MYKLNEKYIKDNNIDLAAVEAHFQKIYERGLEEIKKLDTMLERVRQVDPEYYAQIEKEMP